MTYKKVPAAKYKLIVAEPESAIMDIYNLFSIKGLHLPIIIYITITVIRVFSRVVKRLGKISKVGLVFNPFEKPEWHDD